MTPTASSAFTVVLTSAVNAYRLGMEGQAGEHLANLIDALGGLIGAASADLVLKLNPMLAEVLGAIERKDFLWAADLLEYEIAPLVGPSTAPLVAIPTARDAGSTNNGESL